MLNFFKSKKKVLVVDDDQSLINLLKDYLPKVIKHELFVALTGEEALKILEARKPNVVLLDMQLPGIKGPEVLRIIRNAYPGTKVLVITSYDRQVKEDVAKLGVDGFFPKPIVINEIVDKIREVLKAKGNTTVTPVTLDDIIKRDDVIPKAKILFIEKEFWMPYLLPISESGENPANALVEPYGEYEFEVCYDQEEVMHALAGLRPDIIICATNVPLEDRMGSPSVSTADLISKIMRSRYAPKGIIIHGAQQDIDSHGMREVADDASIWTADINPYDDDAITEKDKENVERLNKMLWKICFEHGLVKKVR